ncbi:MAG: septation protein A [Burkholderiales bacterium]
MKTLLDFLPIVLFFGAFKLYDIYVATGVLMAATVVQMGIIYALQKRLEPLHKITLVMILAFGALTLALHDERFIKWKPTVLYAALSIGLAIALWGFRKNFLKLLLGTQLALPDNVWMRLNAAWIVYCAFMAVINGFVAAYFSTAAWVDFKLWGYVFPLAFLLGQALYISPHLKSDEPGPGSK